MHVKLISDESEWRNVLSSIGEYDFSHTVDFHKIAQANDEGTFEAFAVYGASEDALAFWPVLKRNIPGTALFDYSGVYGYSGPVFRSGCDIERALALIFAEMEQQQAVSLFSRMHPLFVEHIPGEADRGEYLGDIVTIPVTDSADGEDPMTAYRGSHRREITKAKKQGLTISITQSDEALERFRAIYLEAMTEIDASPYYHFSEAYFRSVLTAQDFETIMIFAQFDGVEIGASMFIVTNDVMQYYLSGTASAGKRLSPSKVIISAAHQYAIDHGLNFLVLGGGVGSQNDPLFRFKTGFSKNFKKFYVVKKVFQQEQYDTLCESRGINKDDTDFFPAYRKTQ